ncbi:MAG: hypothetical protein ABIK37_02055 [candidate division WOR-3 bacterium]
MSRALLDARFGVIFLAVQLALWMLAPAGSGLLAFEPLWVDRLVDEGAGGAAVAVDGFGNTYVTGGRPWTGASNTTAMYDRDGHLVWAAPCTLPDLEWVAIGLDSPGNVYVTGTSYGSVQHIQVCDYVVVKYRPTGEQVWTARYSHSPDTFYSWDGAKAACVDAAGNVYVTGRSYDTETGGDCATVKFDSAGTLLWSARWHGGGSIYVVDKGNAVTTDRLGNVYVAGVARGGLHLPTFKYSPDGDLLWAAVDSASGGAVAVAVDPVGNVYSFGTSGIEGEDFYYLVKFDSSGRKLWATSYDGGGDDRAYAMVMDDSAGIYVTGLSDGPGTRWDLCTVKWDSAGNRLWVARYDHARSGDIGEDLATDGKYVYTVGTCLDSNITTHNMCFVTCDAVTGAILWAAPYRYPGTANGDATAVAIGPDGCVHATGCCYDSITADYVTLKYTPSGTGVVSEPGEKPETGLGVVPSLFRGGTSIRYQALRAGRVRIAVLDVAGRTVATLLDADVPKGRGEVTWQAQDLAGGVYFIRLETSGGDLVERVLLVR